MRDSRRWHCRGMTAPQSTAEPPAPPSRPRRPTSAERRLLRATPRLDARFAVLLRGEDAVQIGASPDLAVVVTPPPGVPPQQLAGLLRRLDGSTRLGRALRDARLPLARVGPVLDELARAGLVTSGPERRVPRCVVTVHGAGPLSERLREQLPAIGVEVHSSGTRPDVFSPVEASASSMVVLADENVVEPCIRRMLHEAAMPHMQVHLRDGAGVVGPVVVPGLTGCLDCGDLHRSERDPAWPRLMLQQIGMRGHGDPPTALITVGVAAARVRGFLLGPARAAVAPLLHRPARHGAARRLTDGPGPERLPAELRTMVQVAAGAGGLSMHPWPAHPECPCRAAAPAGTARPAGAPMPPDGGPGHRGSGDGVPAGAGS